MQNMYQLLSLYIDLNQEATKRLEITIDMQNIFGYHDCPFLCIKLY